MSTTKKRREATPEQKAAAAERKARLRKIAGTIAHMTDEQRQQACGGGVFTVEGRGLSLCNTIMVLTQEPRATVVGGFDQWRNAGRRVCKGAKAIGIWIPVGGGKLTPEGTLEVAGGDERKRWIVGNVFDITQTEPANL
jgi:hypothetical protein